MPLNYSKWDQLELSDDSDIEEHPNIDKKSMIRWKQQQIKQERADRTQKIANLRTEISLNGVLRPRILSLLDALKTQPAKEALATYSSLVSKLKNDPSPDKPQTNAPNQPTYDVMLLHLLEQVSAEAKEQTKSGDEQDKVVDRLAERLAHHNGQLDDRTAECERTIGELEEEARRKITSDDIHEGFSSGYTNKIGKNYLDDEKKPAAKAKESSIEVLNPQASSSASGSKAPANAALDPDDEELPDASPLALQFTTIPYLNFAQAFSFIQTNPSILVEQTTDSLLLEGFNAEIAGEKDRARRCVEKGLLVQYCRKLGKDGVRLFFQRMSQDGAAGQKALHLFTSDVDATYQRMESRVQQMAAEGRGSGSGTGEGTEQIQLVAEGDAQISFNVPDGPPPAEIRLEGEGTEGMDPVAVREFLVRQWTIFDGFKPEVKAALREESLEAVNKVLGGMSVDEAEQLVGEMNEAGILSFSDGGAIRDETGAAAAESKTAAAAAGDDDDQQHDIVDELD